MASEFSMGLLAVQCVAVAVLFALGLMVLVPIMSSSFRTLPGLMGKASSFGAGVFITLGVVHLIPEASEKLDDEKWRTAHILVVVGYMIVLGFERALLATHSIADTRQARVREGRMIPVVPEDGSDDGVPRVARDADDGDEEDGMMLEQMDSLSRVRSSAHHQSAYILMAALSVHSVMEGMAIGMQKSLAKTLKMALGVAVHKGTAGLALGSNLVSCRVDMETATKLGVMFAGSTPVGVIVGVIVKALLPDVVSGVVMALSAGTFVYIGCSETVPEEFVTGQTNRAKFLCLTTGAVVVYLLSVLLDFD